jgi:uncharacterized SAM-binding protein YcdF (DUF218 family)
LYIYLSKLLPLMVLPVGLVIELSLLALLFLFIGKRKVSAAFLVVALLVLWVSSMPIVAATLYGKLEQDFPPVVLADIPVSECIVLLGGVVEPVLYPRVDIEMNEAVDRVYKAAQLYRAGKGDVLIVAGGDQLRLPYEQPEAELVQALLVEWGVPVSAIVLDGASRNTRENAVNSSVLMEKLGCDTPLLVTSAAHMARSVAAFEKVGVEVFAVSADVRVIRNSGVTAFDFLPDAGALLMTTDAVREWLGRRVYEFRGWN